MSVTGTVLDKGASWRAYFPLKENNPLGFEYLGRNADRNGFNTWLDVTREERLFCAHLYHDIRDEACARGFVGWLKSSAEWRTGFCPTALVPDHHWEVGYEVCFYRDLLKSEGKRIRHASYPRKRTFDLCLFSEDCIVIIEAKVHESFDRRQVDSIRKDVSEMGHLAGLIAGTGKQPAIVTVALASSIYCANVTRPNTKTESLIKSGFDGYITWKGISEHLGSKLYADADQRYPHSASAK